MILSIVSPKGSFVNKEVEYVVVEGNQGQLAIMNNHLPIVVPINQGFIKEVIHERELFYTVSGAMLEFKDNVVNVITQEIAAGETLALAKKALDQLRSDQKKENQRKMMDFTEMEKELALNLKEIKASKL